MKVLCTAFISCATFILFTLWFPLCSLIWLLLRTRPTVLCASCFRIFEWVCCVNKFTVRTGETQLRITVRPTNPRADTGLTIDDTICFPFISKKHTRNKVHACHTRSLGTCLVQIVMMSNDGSRSKHLIELELVYTTDVSFRQETHPSPLGITVSHCKVCHFNAYLNCTNWSRWFNIINEWNAFASLPR